ncbi:glutamine synthetase family protein [Hyphococcus sp.]|uniref:glutamine synthetase family protein n=1 Tax=Hyphococcus sp. TaxID=2038636 RepID=UPI003CCBDC7F
MLEAVERDDLEVVRFGFADQHGLMRGKAIERDAVASTMVDGCTMVSTLILKDTSHKTVMPVWEAGAGIGSPRLTGGADLIMVPDPSTFRRLPWAKTNGWVQCDLYYPDGEPVAFSTRRILRQALDRLDEKGLEFVSGLELEFHVFRLLDRNLASHDCVQPATPPSISLLQHGYQYLTEIRYDELEPLFESFRRGLIDLNLPLRSEEIEFGPSQLELTFSPRKGLVTADNAVLARNAIKQICQRKGYHATFMCRPHIPNTFSSGWHLHQSLVDKKTGANSFAPDGGNAFFSELGMNYLGGLLKHAKESCILAAPTINAYKRYRPGSLAPDRIQWARDNKGAMLRAVGGARASATRIENRIGEPAANPYLYLSSQLLSGLDGMDAKVTPPPAVEEPYSSQAERLPKSITQALAAFTQSSFYRETLGEDFVNYYTLIKQAEIDRFLSEVTDWEQREYFEMF